MLQRVKKPAMRTWSTKQAGTVPTLLHRSMRDHTHGRLYLQAKTKTRGELSFHPKHSTVTVIMHFAGKRFVITELIATMNAFNIGQSSCLCKALAYMYLVI